MNSNAASTTPTLMATTISNSTVNPKTDQAIPGSSLPGATWNDMTKVLEFVHVPCHQQQQGGQRGQRADIPAAAPVPARPTARTRREDGGQRTRAPARMLAAVRASAPVAAIPPKNGATTLPMPCPISSASGSCLVPVMPSATTAHSSDRWRPARRSPSPDPANLDQSQRQSQHGSVRARQLPRQPTTSRTAGYPARFRPTNSWNRRRDGGD